MQKKSFNVYHGGKLMPWATGTAVWDAKGFVFLSGAEGRDPDTDKVVEGVYAQTKMSLQKIKQRLEEFGTSPDNICHIWYYIVGPKFPIGVQDDPKNQEKNRALREFWAENCPQFLTNPPASTLLGIAGLARKEMLIEIMVIAAIP